MIEGERRNARPDEASSTDTPLALSHAPVPVTPAAAVIAPSHELHAHRRGTP